jgi:hypothetical protein
MPQHQEPAGALQVFESPIFAASQVEVIPSAVQEATTPPPTETAKPTPLCNDDVFLAPDFVKTGMDARETSGALDNVSDTQKRIEVSPTSLSPPASCKLRNIAVSEKTSVVHKDKRNDSVEPDIGESRKDRQRTNKSSSCKPHRKRLMGYQVDFENIPFDDGAPFMTMGHLHSMLLQTGRIRTLGDKVTADGMIYIMSDSQSQLTSGVSRDI